MQEKTNDQKNLQSLALSEDTWLYLQHLDSVYILDPSFEQDDFELTTYSSASQSQGNTINEISTGGLLAGGVASTGLLYDQSSTGGSLAGGVASQTFSDLIEVGGGLFLSGNSFDTTVVYQTTVGGVVISGNVLTSYFYTVFGGANLNGPSSLSSILAENGDTLTNENNIPISTEESVVVNLEYLVFNPAMSGLCLLSGSSIESLIKTSAINENATGGSLAGGIGSILTVYNVVPAGGSLAGGVASQTITYNETSAGGSLAGGVGLETAVYNVVSTGGSLAGGVGLESFSDVVEVSGGSLAGGVSLETAVYNIVPTGGSLAGGIAPQTLSDVIEVSGGSLAGGVGLETAVYNIAATGGSRAGGVALETAVYNIAATGGSLAGAIALESFSDVVEVSGGSLAGGVGSIITIYNVVPTGGSRAGGVSLETFSDVVEVSGGSRAGGVALVTAVYNVVSTGGSLAGGVSLETAVYNVVSTGGSRAGGISEVKLEYNPLSMGGAINNGSSLIYFDYNIISFLNLTINGSASVDLIFLASGGLIGSPSSLVRQEIPMSGGVKVSFSSIVLIDSYNFLRDIKYSFEIGQKVYFVNNNLSPQKTIISRIILENNVFRYVTPLGDFYSNEISPIEEKDKVLNLNIDNIDSNLKTIENNITPPLSQGGFVKFAYTTQQKDKILNISDKINNLNKHKKPPSPKGGKFVLTSNNSNSLIANNREKIMKKIKQLSGG